MYTKLKLYGWHTNSKLRWYRCSYSYTRIIIIFVESSAPKQKSSLGEMKIKAQVYGATEKVYSTHGWIDFISFPTT